MRPRQFIIKSSNKGTSLSFERINEQQLRVILDGGSFKGGIKAFDEDWNRLAHYFADISLHGKGWTGEKVFENLEGQVYLSATSDSLGHVHMKVRIVYDEGDRWETSGTIAMDSGALTEIAKTAELFLR